MENRRSRRGLLLSLKKLWNQVLEAKQSLLKGSRSGTVIAHSVLSHFCIILFCFFGSVLVSLQDVCNHVYLFIHPTIYI